MRCIRPKACGAVHFVVLKTAFVEGACRRHRFTESAGSGSGDGEKKNQDVDETSIHIFKVHSPYATTSHPLSSFPTTVHRPTTRWQLALG